MGHYSPNDYRLYLVHHGIPGMHWGVRRYQNKDGSLTTSGKTRYSGAKQESFGSKSAKRLSEYYNDEMDLGRHVQRSIMGLQSEAKAYRDISKASKNAKTKSERFTESVGSGAKRTRLNARADYMDSLVETYKGKDAKEDTMREARNLRRQAEFYDKKAQNYSVGGKKALRQASRDILLGHFDKLKIPYETEDGRIVSTGRYKFNKMVSEAVIGAALNVATEGLYSKVRKN